MRDLVELLYAYRFLGREFLIWLWYASETAPDGLISLPGQEGVQVEIGDRLVLETGDGQYRETLVLQGSRSDLPEARLGLRQGKLPEEVQLKVARGREEWFLNLKATTLEVKGLRRRSSPPAPEGDEAEAQFFDQMYQVEAVSDLLDGLFRLFLDRRLSPAWEQEELPRLRDWLLG